MAELELDLQTIGQQKQQALDQIVAMEEKATEVDLQLKSEAQQKAEAIEKVELLELCVTELKRQLEEQSDKQLESDEQVGRKRDSVHMVSCTLYWFYFELQPPFFPPVA